MSIGASGRDGRATWVLMMLTLTPPENPEPSHPPVSEMLEPLRIGVRLATLYRDLFPEDETCLEAMAPTDTDALCQAVERFLERVDTDYFPVWAEIFSGELEWAESFLYQIPIAPQGLDLWDEYEVDVTDEPIRLLAEIARHEIPFGEVDEAYPLPFSFPMPLAHLSDVLRLMPLPTPLREGLPHAIDFVCGQTGTGWLDVSWTSYQESGEWLPWDDIELVVSLKTRWKKAEMINEAIAHLSQWLDDAHPKHFRAVVCALLLSYSWRNWYVEKATRENSAGFVSRTDLIDEILR